jgi:hypothetical protein
MCAGASESWGFHCDAEQLTPPGSMNAAIFTIARLAAIVLAMGRTVDDLVGITDELIQGRNLTGAQPLGMQGLLQNLATPAGNKYAFGSPWRPSGKGCNRSYSYDEIQTPTPRGHYTPIRGNARGRGGPGRGRGRGGQASSSSGSNESGAASATSANTNAKKRKQDGEGEQQ